MPTHTVKIIAWNTTGESDAKRQHLQGQIATFNPDIIVLQELALPNDGDITDFLNTTFPGNVVYANEGGTQNKKYAVVVRNGYTLAGGLTAIQLEIDPGVVADISTEPYQERPGYTAALVRGRDPVTCQINAPGGAYQINLCNWHVTEGDSTLNPFNYIQYFEKCAWYTGVGCNPGAPNVSMIVGDLNVGDVTSLLGPFRGMSSGPDHVLMNGPARVNKTGENPPVKYGTHYLVKATLSWN